MKEIFYSLILCILLGSGTLFAEEGREQKGEIRREGEARRANPRVDEREKEGRVSREEREGDRRPDREVPRDSRFRREGDSPPPPNVRRDGDREGGVRPGQREGDRARPPFVRRDGEGDRNRPPFRPPFNREGAGRDRPPLPHGREGGSPSPELQREAQRREVMIDLLRDELRRSQQLNAELRNRMQLLEQRLSKLEKR